MHTINANTYNATAQAISDAIERSISHDEIVTIEAGLQREAIEDELRENCDGSICMTHDQDDGPLSEFWGANLDGEAWRVHVRSL